MDQIITVQLKADINISSFYRRKNNSRNTYDNSYIQSLAFLHDMNSRPENFTWTLNKDSDCIFIEDKLKLYIGTSSEILTNNKQLTIRLPV